MFAMTFVHLTVNGALGKYQSIMAGNADAKGKIIKEFKKNTKHAYPVTAGAKSKRYH
jgi:hypothetical protein